MLQVAAWPGVSRIRADCGVGQALAIGGRQIAHLHHDTTIELWLGRPAIARMGEALMASGQVAVRSSADAGRDWVSVGLHVPGDETLAIALASVAIQAVGAGERHEPAGCALADRGRSPVVQVVDRAAYAAARR
jgi:hypothetical protein